MLTTSTAPPDSFAKTYNGGTNLSFGFAMDAVIDDRATSMARPIPPSASPSAASPATACRSWTATDLSISDTTGSAGTGRRLQAAEHLR